MRLRDVRGVGRAQGLARRVIHDVGETLRCGDTEIGVVERLEAAFARAGVRGWLHTPYAWFGDRTRFAGFVHWEPDALPTGRRLEEGDPYILDAAPFVSGQPADYALSGRLGPPSPEQAALHEELARLKRELVAVARERRSGRALFEWVASRAARAGSETVHQLYPAAALGHSLDALPRGLERLPRLGRGFQIPLIGGYALALLRHRFAGDPWPLLNPMADAPPQGLWAIEPHLGRGDAGAKFESILLVDGDETRWLDPGLFGDVEA